MTPESEALLNALVPAPGSISTDHTDAIYDLLEPLHAILEQVEGHVTEIDRLRRKADAVETDPTIYGWFERIKQTIDATRTKNADAKRALEAISDVAFQLDTYANEMRATLALNAEVRTAEPRINMTRVEADFLRASADEANARLAEALAKLNEKEEK